MTILTIFGGISRVVDQWNSLATICALILSAGSLIIQYQRSKREVGKLELSEVDNPKYMTVAKDVYGIGGSKTTFSVTILGRNVRDGVVRIYDVKVDINGLNENMDFRPNDDFPIAVKARDELDERLSAELDAELDLGDSVDAEITFKTSNNNPTIQTTLERRP